MTLSKYDKEFAEAMKVKLKLNRKMRSKAGEESAQLNGSSVPLGDQLRNGIAEATIAENPGLTKEEVLRDMEKMGF